MTRRLTWQRVVVSGCVMLGAYVLFLVLLAPATLLDAGLRHATDGRLRLAQAHGTLWSGSGRIEVLNPAGKVGIGKELSWRLQPGALWRGRVDYEAAIDHASSSFPVRLSLRGVDVSNLDFSLPASALGIAVPHLAPLGPRGELTFHVNRLSRVGNSVSADAIVRWKDASSALTPVAPLGTYELRLGSSAGHLNATLGSSSGPLRLEGSGTWGDSGSSAFSATARVDAQHRAQLAPLLRLIAIERGNGDFVLQLHQPLSGLSAGVAPK